ncbi:MAG TPA: hypothetical protein OIM20_07800 [Eggerthellaceae bacterium]|nr:hypothetical protein [Eggerthellaceae bacterium]
MKSKKAQKLLSETAKELSRTGAKLVVNGTEIDTTGLKAGLMTGVQFSAELLADDADISSSPRDVANNVFLTGTELYAHMLEDDDKCN